MTDLKKLLEIFTCESVCLKDAEQNKIEFSENDKSKNKVYKCQFSSKKKLIQIKSSGNKQIWALKTSKIGDGAFIVFDEDKSISLHILEMKSGLNRNKLEDAIQQLEGMYMASIAILKLLKLPDPKNITAYISYEKDKIDTNTFYANKQEVGKPNVNLKIWHTENMAFYDGSQAKLFKAPRQNDVFSLEI